MRHIKDGKMPYSEVGLKRTGRNIIVTRKRDRIVRTYHLVLYRGQEKHLDPNMK